MQLIPLMNVHFDLREPFDVGEGPFGKRVVYDVNGGTFDGDRLRGRVLPCSQSQHSGLFRASSRAST